MKKIILLKLGGSLITDKDKVNVARFEVIKDLADQLNLLNRSESVKSAGTHFIIATGAGGFGHPVAKKYENNLKEGLPYIKEAVKKINKIVVEALNKVGVKAESVEPSKVVEYENGKMTKLLDGYIVNFLNSNIIPVFHADLIDDKKLGTSILSMDRFLVDVAIYLKNKGFEVKKVIFCGTTDGVLDNDGKTIDKINQTNINKLNNIFYDNNQIDISGGMKNKIQECLRLVGNDIISVIINGEKKQNLQKTILSNAINKTIIE